MPHQRRNALTGEWILVSPHRLLRPWGGQTSKPSSSEEFASASTYLSPGAKRSNGAVNPPYTSTFVFSNDFPALIPEGLANQKTGDISRDMGPTNEDALFQSKPAGGECHVMCFTPHSNLSLPLMPHDDIIVVIREWMKQSILLSHYAYVQIFENKGAMVGCSNSHPHCQIWASEFIPDKILCEDAHQREYFLSHANLPLLCDYLQKELSANTRIVQEGAHWVALVPYWAKWPYELLVIPKRHVTKLKDLSDDEVDDLAKTMKKFLVRYDNKFRCSFPYSMGWHEAPNVMCNHGDTSGDHGDTSGNHGNMSHWQLHAHYYPPLLRSASVKKHFAGYELLAQVQRDLTAETAAEELRACNENVHYTEYVE